MTYVIIYNNRVLIKETYNQQQLDCSKFDVEIAREMLDFRSGPWNNACVILDVIYIKFLSMRLSRSNHHLLRYYKLTILHFTALLWPDACLHFRDGDATPHNIQVFFILLFVSFLTDLVFSVFTNSIVHLVFASTSLVYIELMIVPLCVQNVWPEPEDIETRKAHTHTPSMNSMLLFQPLP